MHNYTTRSTEPVWQVMLWCGSICHTH